MAISCTQIQASVVIPHYNDLPGLKRCLDALDHQSIEKERYEVIVADNQSLVGQDIIMGLINGRARLVIVAERGAGPARNGGVNAASGDVLAFIDADCIPSKHWLEYGLTALERYDVVGGHVSVLVEQPDCMTGAEAFESVFAFNFAQYIEKKGFAGSGNMFVKRVNFDAVGGFRKEISEDVDWCRRACALGLTLGYASSAEVGHPARSDWYQLLTKWKRVHLELYALSGTKRFGRIQWLFRTWLMPVSAFVHIRNVLFCDKLPNNTVKWRAIQTLFRLRWWRFVDGNVLFFKGSRRSPSVLDLAAWYSRNQ